MSVKKVNKVIGMIMYFFKLFVVNFEALLLTKVLETQQQVQQVA